MPGFDGTGPRGNGPMTGGGRGYCAVPYGGNRRRGVGFGRGFGRGQGRGFGRGLGVGRGRGYGRGFRGGLFFDDVYPDEISAKEEAQYLKEEQVYLKKELENVQKRLKDLEKSEEE